MMPTVQSHHLTLETDVFKLLQEVGLPHTLLEELPKRYYPTYHRKEAALALGSFVLFMWNVLGLADNW